MIWANDPGRMLQGQQQSADARMGFLNRGAENYRANLGAQTQRYGMDLQQDRFNRLYGLLSGQLGGGGGMGGGFGGAGMGMGSPAISVAPIWNQRQIQQQVNAGQAASNASGQTQARTTANRLAGQGYAPTSPLAAALQSQQQMATMQRNSDIGRQIPWEAAQANAGHILRAQTARDQGVVGRINAQTELARTNAQSRSALYNALAGLI